MSAAAADVAKRQQEQQKQDNLIIDTTRTTDYLNFNVKNDNKFLKTLYPTKPDRNSLDYYQNSVTGTPKPQTTELDDVFISVKTTKNYHDTRLSMIIKTWFQLAKDQVSVRCLSTLFIGLKSMIHSYLILTVSRSLSKWNS